MFPHLAERACQNGLYECKQIRVVLDTNLRCKFWLQRYIFIIIMTIQLNVRQSISWFKFVTPSSMDSSLVFYIRNSSIALDRSMSQQNLLPHNSTRFHLQTQYNCQRWWPFLGESRADTSTFCLIWVWWCWHVFRPSLYSSCLEKLRLLSKWQRFHPLWLSCQPGLQNYIKGRLEGANLNARYSHPVMKKQQNFLSEYLEMIFDTPQCYTVKSIKIKSQYI